MSLIMRIMSIRSIRRLILRLTTKPKRMMKIIWMPRPIYLYMRQDNISHFSSCRH